MSDISPKTAILYFAIDVETSGLRPVGGDWVIKCAAVKIFQGKIVSEFNTLINVPGRIHPGAQRLHGISRDMLHNQTEPDEAWPEFLEFIGRAPLIAHNARFDMKFTRHELGRLGKRLKNKSLCTLCLASRRYPQLQNHRLETVTRHVLGTIPEDCRLHRALGDARLVAQLWLAMKVK
ncbi:MAG: 3'-5' exonuclease [Candidatus Marinimicrobia bacterium]|nr:3'-5' exonuclease [Candidatus Neomarinimicrobiota bacterium]